MEERICEESSEAEAESDRLRRASDDVLMRIGRNLLVYQRIETHLKQLAAGRLPLTFGPGTSPDDVLAQITANRARVERHTLGQALMRTFVETNTSEKNGSRDNGPISLTISTRTVFEDNLEFREWLKECQETFVASRNRLAHGFLDAFDIETVEGCEQARDTLDDAHETALHFLHWVRSCCQDQVEMRKLALEFLRSDEFEVSFRFSLMLQDLARTLGMAAQRLGRPDGWCVYDLADQAMRASEGELVAEVLDCGQFRTLQEAAKATGAFAWHEEKNREETRWLFRWQPSE